MQLSKPERIDTLKDKMLSVPRYVSVEQALITTKIYKENEDKATIIKRALSLKAALENLEIQIEPEELIVGNRTVGPRYGVITPEAGSSWVSDELDTIPTRAQDKFKVREEDIKIFNEEIHPYWEGKSLEDIIEKEFGSELSKLKKVVKINQTDHAQGHICPDCKTWLKLGPSGILDEAKEKLSVEKDQKKKDFYQSVIYVMEGAKSFMLRYHNLLLSEAEKKEHSANKKDMLKVGDVCKNLSERPAENFHEAVQSVWFLFVILHMESNASSFSPGRMDSFLYPYYKKDKEENKLTDNEALELIECLFLKFNQIVYLRNKDSAKYFAGFPIGFNIALGGQTSDGKDFCNELSHLFLTAQEHLLLPQPNLSVRLHQNTNEEFLKHAVRVVGKGSGMPQFFNDAAIIEPMIEGLEIEREDAYDYAVVGCVELTTQGNNLGWSDAAMFNFNKVLELTLNNGKCLLTGEKLGLDLGSLEDYKTYEKLEDAFAKQIDYFTDKMIEACYQVEKAHIEVLPSPFLSSVINDCIKKGIDVTDGGAKYNFSGITMIQVANLVDSLAAMKELIYEQKRITQKELLSALKDDFKGHDITRHVLLNKANKYGNDVEEIDEIGNKWGNYLKDNLKKYKNYRGGKIHTAMYTVSAHVPMGQNVGASADGRKAKEPLADGGMSPVYGRDMKGPTAVLKSVSKLDNELTTNGGLLNMKFLPDFFSTEEGIDKFAKFLRTLVDLEIPHIQFNVLNNEDLRKAKENPEKYQNMTVRVAGYTAYFVELAEDLQDEIIERNCYGDVF